MINQIFFLPKSRGTEVKNGKNNIIDYKSIFTISFTVKKYYYITFTVKLKKC